MASLNKQLIIGRLGKDPEVRYTGSGTAVCTFSVASSEKWKGEDGEQKESTTWFNIVAWKKLAEICGEYLKKGSLVYLEGRTQNRSYDAKDGTKKYVSEVVLEKMVMLDSKRSDESAPEVPGAASGDDSLPF